MLRYGLPSCNLALLLYGRSTFDTHCYLIQQDANQSLLVHPSAGARAFDTTSIAGGRYRPSGSIDFRHFVVYLLVVHWIFGLDCVP